MVEYHRHGHSGSIHSIPIAISMLALVLTRYRTALPPSFFLSGDARWRSGETAATARDGEKTDTDTKHV